MCTTFPDFSHLETATKIFLVKMTVLLEDPLESKKYLRDMIMLLGEMLVTSRHKIMKTNCVVVREIMYLLDEVLVTYLQ